MQAVKNDTASGVKPFGQIMQEFLKFVDQKVIPVTLFSTGNWPL